MSETAPKSLRLHIALLGRVNAGKSSFLNLVCGQSVAVTSGEPGTTTDVVEKNQELLPIGPITWLDTPGLGDTTILAEKRLAKTRQIFDRADVIVLLLNGDTLQPEEQQVIDEAEKRKIPLIKIYTKADEYPIETDAISVNSLDLSSRDRVLNELKSKLLEICPEEFIKTPPILGDLVPKDGIVVMIVPIDYEAPKGRIILPQVQAIRNCLDNNQIITVVKENDYLNVLQNLKKAPDLVVCDSQVVRQMVEQTPKNIKCTTFSILMARLKGNLPKLVEGAEAIWRLQDGDRVLIAESCTHHAIEDDIGRVKIPKLLAEKTGRQLIVDHVAGCEFPGGLAKYDLVIQCGGCMQNRKEILSRINQCETAGVPITNYGICLSALNGVLERVLEPFSLKYKKKGRK